MQDAARNGVTAPLQTAAEQMDKVSVAAATGLMTATVDMTTCQQQQQQQQVASIAAVAA
jgi:hypothetical protein